MSDADRLMEKLTNPQPRPIVERAPFYGHDKDLVCRATMDSNAISCIFLLKYELCPDGWVGNLADGILPECDYRDHFYKSEEMANA